MILNSDTKICTQYTVYYYYYNSVSKFFKWNIQSAKYRNINYTDVNGNDITKFIDYQISANTLM